MIYTTKQNRAEINEITDGNSLLASYKNEIEQLKRQLVETQRSLQDNQKPISDELAALQEKREEEYKQLQESQERLDLLQKLILVSKVIKKTVKVRLQELSVISDTVIQSFDRRRCPRCDPATTDIWGQWSHQQGTSP